MSPLTSQDSSQQSHFIHSYLCDTTAYYSFDALADAVFAQHLAATTWSPLTDALYMAGPASLVTVGVR
jgi:hypothetical protein